jgi:hypothetical protein
VTTFIPRTIVFPLLLLIVPFCFAQLPDSLKGDTSDVGDDRAIEKLIENQTTDVEDSKLLDYLLKLETDPLDLNTVTAKELEKIPYISAVAAKNIISYREKHKKFISVAELKLIEGIDEDLYRKIIRFVAVRGTRHDVRKEEVGKPERVQKSKFHFRMRNRFTNDLQPGYGYFKSESLGGFVGTRPKIYNRLEAKFSLKKLKFAGGLITEKDAGESKLFDFIAGFAEMKNTGFFNQILAGDYTLEFGQGITLWSGLTFSKGNDAVAGVKKHGDDIDSYTSVNEIQFFRGGASKFKLESSLGDFSLFGFYSDNYFDANIDTTFGQISTIYYDGYHRTNSELNKENTAKERLFGGRFFYERQSVKFGVTYYRSEFSKPFEKDRIYDFSGDRTNAIGADYDIIFKNMNLFGEWARSYTGAVGGISGARVLFFSEKLVTDLVFAIRNYPKDFVMLHAFGFGEQSGVTQNEFGIYSGVKFKIPGLLTVDAYLDQYKFPYRTFFKPVPTEGRDLLIFAESKLSRELTLYAKYKNENKENVIKTNDEFGHQVERIFDRGQSNYRIQFDYDISRTFCVRSRCEYVFVDYDGFQSSEKGLMFFGDFRVKPLNRLLIDGRFIIFQTDSYDSRIYEYESELQGVVHNPALYGKGRRWYVILKYLPFDFLQLSGKYSETYYDGVKSIGSGNDQVMGDFKNRLSLQLDLKL